MNCLIDISCPPNNFLSESDYILCQYNNDTREFQILRITNIPNWYFEKTVTPSTSIEFKAPPEALLEIHSSMMPTAILSDTIPCTMLICHL